MSICRSSRIGTTTETFNCFRLSQPCLGRRSESNSSSELDASVYWTRTSTSLAEAVGAYEPDLIQDALKTTRGNRVQAAKLLKSTERIISYKVKKYDIDGHRFRD